MFLAKALELFEKEDIGGLTELLSKENDSNEAMMIREMLETLLFSNNKEVD